MSSAVDIPIPVKLPLLALAGEVLFPGCEIRITVTSANAKNFELVKSRLLTDLDSTSLERSSDGNGPNNPIIGLMPRGLSKEAETLRETSSMSLIGTAAVVNQVTADGWPNPTFAICLSGLSRIHVEKLVMEVPYPVAVVSVPADANKYVGTSELKEAVNTFRSLVLMLLNLAADSSSFYVNNMKRMILNASTLELPDLFTSFFATTYAEKLQLLGTFDLLARYKLTTNIVMRQTKALHSSVVEHGFPKTRGTFIVRMVPRDVGPAGSGRQRHPFSGGRPHAADDLEGDSLLELLNKLKAAQLPPHAMKVAMKDLQRIKRLTPSSAELPVIRAYLELMSELPWAKSSSETLDIAKAKQDLDADHYAMDKLKQRVLEYLAVRQLKNSLRGPILCFVGPPGVGKTSIGRSIANTLNREFHRISLGGVCNQSDIRGHRRTYIGAMPGRIIQGLKTVGVNNPIFLLDEVDKLRAGVQGDPGAALLEVLDPEQNHTFHDHYLNVPFDLSQVMFIATANDTKTIPRALLDRMEVISVDGYTHEEKLHIALRHLIPKQVSQHGLDEGEIKLPPDTVKMLIKGYTREAGVRSLERRLGAVCRAVAVRVADARRREGEDVTVHPFVIDCETLEEILGPALYSDTELRSRLGRPGVAMGLSVSAVGGDVLLVEASKMEGDGELQLTGQLGSVMKESANLALSYLRTCAYKYGLSLDSETLSRTDIHVHFPAGATAKEGPSAGVALVTVLVSLFSGRPVATDVAMTGEISLKGAVLPVGGVKAKVLAAHRMGIRRIILPEKNANELRKISEEVKSELTFILVSHVDEVIQAAFVGGFPTSANPEHVQSVVSKL